MPNNDICNSIIQGVCQCNVMGVHHVQLLFYKARFCQYTKELFVFIQDVDNSMNSNELHVQLYKPMEFVWYIYMIMTSCVVGLAHFTGIACEIPIRAWTFFTAADIEHSSVKYS